MGHEISQFDIPDRQLLATNAQPRVDRLMDIGEAKITRTIFGRTKVRVIRERDKKLRAWLLTALAVMAIAAIAWRGWIALQQMQSAPPPLPLSERIRISAPVFQTEDFTTNKASVKRKSETLIQTEIDSLVAGPKSAPPQPPGLNATKPMAAKPVTAKPLTASKPQTAPLATNNNASKNQTGMQQPPKLSVPTQPAAPAVAAPPATQPAANKPAAIAPLAAPLIKEDTSTLPPAVGNQPPDPVNAKPRDNAQP